MNNSTSKLMTGKFWTPAYAFVLATIALAEGVETVFDLATEGLSVHAAMDLAMIPLVLVGVYYIASTASKSVQTAREHMEQAQADLTDFRQKNENILLKMRSAVHEQFAAWKLSRAEVRVAELLIRGYSSKEIAEELGKSERTVRNQAISLYRKAGLTGRGDLSAFFLSDIMADSGRAPVQK